MKTSIKLLLSAAVLAASSTAAFGQTVITGTLDSNSPLFERPHTKEPGEECELNGVGPFYSYAAYTADHAGGELTVRLESTDYANDGYDPFLGIYNDTFNPSLGCQNAVEYVDDTGGAPNALISGNYPAGRYVIVATTWSPDLSSGSYALTTNATNVAPWAPTAAKPVAVPAAGIPALALGSLGLIGAAGFVSRRRKAKAEKA